MRLVLLLFLLMRALLRADSLQDKLDPLGGNWRLQPGGRSVEIIPYKDLRLWLNGTRLKTHDEETYTIREGDCVDAWEEKKCWRYSFVAITPRSLILTRWGYASVREDIGGSQVRMKSGQLRGRPSQFKSHSCQS